VDERTAGGARCPTSLSSAGPALPSDGR